MGEEKREHLWSSAAATMSREKSSPGHPEHFSCSHPSSGAVGGLCHKIFQNCVEGPSVHTVSSVCTEGGDAVCNGLCAVKYR